MYVDKTNRNRGCDAKDYSSMFISHNGGKFKLKQSIFLDLFIVPGVLLKTIGCGC